VGELTVKAIAAGSFLDFRGAECFMRAIHYLGALVVVIIVQLNATQAALISADFNDLSSGNLNGKGGGTGFTGNWSGSSNPTVAASTMTSTLYNKPQAGTNNVVSGSNGAIRQNYRTPNVTLAGEIWFSFLARVNGADAGRSGLSLNPGTATPFEDRGLSFLELQGGSSAVNLQYQFGAGSPTTVSTGITDFTSTILVVGKLNMAGSSGADSIKVWVNPDLMANADINSYTPLVDVSGANFIDAINTIGVITYKSSGTGNGNFDNLWMSDGNGNPNQAFFDVTGVNAIPEPSSFVVAGLFLTSFLVGRKLRAKIV
jgi:hypothetical protein